MEMINGLRDQFEWEGTWHRTTKEREKMFGKMGREGEVGVEEKEPVQGMGDENEEKVRDGMVTWRRTDMGGEVQ